MRSRPPNGTTDHAPIVFCDFDGTITEIDVTDEILTRLAAPSWREIEEEWVRGRIGSRQCLERQMALVETTAAELDALLDAIPVDPGFPGFVNFVRRRSMPFYVVSDGFDYVIRRILKRCGVNRTLRNGSHLFSSSLGFAGRRLVASFPHAPTPCEHRCATCKPAVIRRLRGGRGPVIFIGDGLSDRFAVGECNLVFAKKQLLAYCDAQGIPCHAFETFDDVAAALPSLIQAGEARVGSLRPARVALVRNG